MATSTRNFRSPEPLAPAAAWLGDGEAVWAADLRAEARGRLAARGLPTAKAETWRHTNLNRLLALTPAPEAPSGTPALDHAPGLLAGEAVAARLVFVDGRLNPALSQLDDLPAGLEIRPLAAVLDDGEADEALAHEDATRPFHDLAIALMSDGMVLELGPGTVLERPIECVHIALADDGAKAHHLRHLIRLGAESAAEIVESRLTLGSGATLVNESTSIDLAAGARLSLTRLYECGAEDHGVRQSFARLDKRARLEAFVALLGGALNREEIVAELVGEVASCELAGVYLLADRQHGDIITEVTHAVPDTASNQVFKGVLDDWAQAVFQGRVTVAPGAQGTDGRQLNKTLLLSDKAEIDTKPELEIYADDVKCAHGATTGALDEDALFYLRARGIPLERAQRMLVEAFLTDALEGVTSTPLREALATRIQAWSTKEEEA